MKSRSKYMVVETVTVVRLCFQVLTNEPINHTVVITVRYRRLLREVMISLGCECLLYVYLSSSNSADSMAFENWIHGSEYRETDYLENGE